MTRPKTPRTFSDLLASARRMQTRYAAKGWEFSPRAVAGTLRIEPTLACQLINALMEKRGNKRS